MQNRLISDIRLFLGFIFMSICMHTSVYSQDTAVKRQKVRVVNGSIPIPFVAVINISTSEQAISDADGLVFLPFRNPTDTLIFRSMGYELNMILPGDIIGQFLPMDESQVSLSLITISEPTRPY